MSLNLKQLVQIAPVEEEVRKKVMQQEESLTEEQKFKISLICWRLLSVIFENRRKQKFDEMLKEVSEGGIEYQSEDFTRAEDEIVAEFLIKIDQTTSTEDLAAVKIELQKHVSQKPSEAVQPAPHQAGN